MDKSKAEGGVLIVMIKEDPIYRSYNLNNCESSSNYKVGLIHRINPTFQAQYLRK
jgi:hypothetical protein